MTDSDRVGKSEFDISCPNSVNPYNVDRDQPRRCRWRSITASANVSAMRGRSPLRIECSKRDSVGWEASLGPFHESRSISALKAGSLPSRAASMVSKQPRAIEKTR